MALDRQLYSRWQDAKALCNSLTAYAANNNGQYPSSLAIAVEDMEVQLSKQSTTGQTATTTKESLQAISDRFEIVFRGKASDISNPASTIILRETQAGPFLRGGLSKTYGFADGHIEAHISTDGNFEAWEAQHGVVITRAADGPVAQ